MTAPTEPNALAAELLPCPNPWCEESKPIANEVYTGEGWFVRCKSCDIVTPIAGTEAEAITAWNTRTATPDALAGEAVERRAKQIGDSRGDPNWWRYEDEARAALSHPTPEQGAVEALREALTPSSATKAAYIGEFSFLIEEQGDDAMCPVSRKIDVPWTTIKEIMAAIRARAALGGQP